MVFDLMNYLLALSSLDEESESVEELDEELDEESESEDESLESEDESLESEDELLESDDDIEELFLQIFLAFTCEQSFCFDILFIFLFNSVVRDVLLTYFCGFLHSYVQ